MFFFFFYFFYFLFFYFFFFQAEDGIRDFCLSRGLGDVYKRQVMYRISEGLGVPLSELIAQAEEAEKRDGTSSKTD